MTSIIADTLSNLDSLGIPYVVWKNIQDIDKALLDKSDLDIYIPSVNKCDAISFFKNNGWIQFDNPIAIYPWVIHLYKVSELQCSHLHIYFKIVTGESWLKEYILPTPEHWLKNRVKSKEHNLWVLDNQSQCEIFIIRYLLKGLSLSSRYLYKNEIASYSKEWRAASDNFDLEKFNKKYFIDTAFLKNLQIDSQRISLPSLSSSLKARIYFSGCLRFSIFSLIFRRLYSFVRRFINKFLLRQGKMFIGPGLVIAISGLDGAGKSTLLRSLIELYGSFLTVKTYHLGRPYGKVLDYLRKSFKKSRCSAIRVSTKKDGNQELSALFILKSVFIALLRLQMAKCAIKSALKGKLILVDRWPINVIGKMDGPRITSTPTSSLMQRYGYSIEKWVYDLMPRADICIYLQVPLETALTRNTIREKEEKETDEELIARYEVNSGLKPIADKIIYYDNSNTFEKCKLDIISIIWDEICSRK
tara:strand:+ start:95768 stop:97186 length:1419 start_codon:yes stop_codon:yes gene_type:complete